MAQGNICKIADNIKQIIQKKILLLFFCKEKKKLCIIKDKS